MIDTAVPYAFRQLGNGCVIALQQRSGFPHPQIVQILDGRYTVYRFKAFPEIAGTDAAQPCKGIICNIRFEIAGVNKIYRWLLCAV